MWCKRLQIIVKTAIPFALIYLTLSESFQYHEEPAKILRAKPFTLGEETTSLVASFFLFTRFENFNVTEKEKEAKIYIKLINSALSPLFKKKSILEKKIV